MTPKQEIFVREYLIDLNATRAAKRAGYKASYARRACFVLLRRPAVAAAVAEGMAARARRLEIDADRVLKEYAKIGFANIGNLAVWGKNGVELREHSEISADDAAAIVELSLTGKNRARIKLHDKRAALGALLRHLGIGNGKRDPIAAIYSDAAQRRARAALKERILKVIAERDEKKDSGGDAG